MLLLTTLLAFVFAQQCTTIGIRPEYHTLSEQQRQTFVNTMNRARDAGILRRYADFHAQYNTWIHSNNQGQNNGITFMYWHRVFLQAFEIEIQGAFDSNFRMPYFNSMIYTRNWRESDFFERTRSFTARQLVNQNMPNEAEWRATQYNQNGRLHTMEQYSFFAELLHGTTHNNVGGTMQTMQSPLDPLFFMHHAFIDGHFQLMLDLIGSGNIYGTGVFNAQLQWVTPNGRTNLPGFTTTNLYSLARQCIRYPGLRLSPTGRSSSIVQTRASKAMITKIRELDGIDLANLGDFTCSPNTLSEEFITLMKLPEMSNVVLQQLCEQAKRIISNVTLEALPEITVQQLNAFREITVDPTIQETVPQGLPSAGITTSLTWSLLLSLILVI
jgi:hypothetical protein